MAKQPKENSQNKMAELQMLHQRLNIFGQQKQQLQIQLLETDNALRELQNSKAPAYKLIGDLLIEKNSSELNKELTDRKEDLNLRIKSLENQESKTKDKAMELQKEVAADFNN
ncbi:MAG: prefoldin subunit [DPANN group archaeon]|nr:prefoldin subunit [DPANN group archaeon]